MEIVTLTLNENGKIVDVDFVARIMNEIAEKVYTRKDVAKTYAILIQKGHNDWAPINQAIMKRWSKSGLLWIKTEAWKQVNAEAAKAVTA
jgi:hypothetical protein